MAYEFTKLSEVQALSEVPENATILAEVGGSIKRVPGSGLGGGNTLIITDSEFAGAVSGSSASTLSSATTTTYTANMTFESAIAAFRAQELTNVIGYVVTEGATVMPLCLLDATSTYNQDCLWVCGFMGSTMAVSAYWTADSFSTEEPSIGK